MNMRNVVGAMAIVGLIATPAVAQVDRAGAPVSEDDEMGGGSVILAILAVAAIIAGIIIAVGGDDDPVSP